MNKLIWLLLLLNINSAHAANEKKVDFIFLRDQNVIAHQFNFFDLGITIQDFRKQIAFLGALKRATSVDEEISISFHGGFFFKLEEYDTRIFFDTAFGKKIKGKYNLRLAVHATHSLPSDTWRKDFRVPNLDMKTADAIEIAIKAEKFLYDFIGADHVDIFINSSKIEPAIRETIETYYQNPRKYLLQVPGAPKPLELPEIKQQTLSEFVKNKIPRFIDEQFGEEEVEWYRQKGKALELIDTNIFLHEDLPTNNTIKINPKYELIFSSIFKRESISKLIHTVLKEKAKNKSGSEQQQVNESIKYLIKYLRHYMKKSENREIIITNLEKLLFPSFCLKMQFELIKTDNDHLLYQPRKPLIYEFNFPIIMSFDEILIELNNYFQSANIFNHDTYINNTKESPYEHNFLDRIKNGEILEFRERYISTAKNAARILISN